MKKLTRKLFISILSMAFAVIAIGTTTFAWITISTTATVDQFSADVEAGAGGIEVSWDQVTWSSKLSNVGTKITDFNGFSDITYNGQTFKELVIEDNVAKESENVTGKYITFSFYIRNTNPEGGLMNVAVEDVVFGHGSASGSITTDVAIPEVKNGETVTAAALTAGSTVEGLLVSNAARMMITASKIDTEDDSKNHSSIIYEQSTTENNTVQWNKETGFAHRYFVAKGYSFGSLSVPNYSTSQAGVTSGTICTLAEDAVKITVTVWVEGWDNECHANVLSQTLNVAFGFVATAAQ